ncbi:hypothetical protein [Metamycoplasma hyosynoviae]|uniref:hypothetical protein n=1 Tax=Metamycoplasma hyosynoviae TaxID=29559 RepID=UPI000461D8B4|nr:hypothetical protein [Metamycoplasma hyosynoviae]KDE42511.1 hypothetical protein NPL1_03335 [Metamycoplasma hyosynoviae]MDD1359074.1 hypothetical protein [Metamycoplasma hyosynoviae]MDD7897091.1 hypothetical protein [Metamycoplasma hyosynoviae]
MKNSKKISIIFSLTPVVFTPAIILISCVKTQSKINKGNEEKKIIADNKIKKADEPKKEIIVPKGGTKNGISIDKFVELIDILHLNKLGLASFNADSIKKYENEFVNNKQIKSLEIISYDDLLGTLSFNMTLKEENKELIKYEINCKGFQLPFAVKADTFKIKINQEKLDNEKKKIDDVTSNLKNYLLQAEGFISSSGEKINLLDYKDIPNLEWSFEKTQNNLYNLKITTKTRKYHNENGEVATDFTILDVIMLNLNN